MVVRAIKTIGQGEQINENYGPIFTQKRKDERQRILKERYWFDCRCQPCVEDWPPINEMTNDALRFRCSERRCRKPLVVPVDTMTPFITCPSCKKGNNILKVKKDQLGNKSDLVVHHWETENLKPTGDDPWKNFNDQKNQKVWQLNLAAITLCLLTILSISFKVQSFTFFVGFGGQHLVAAISPRWRMVMFCRWPSDYSHSSAKWSSHWNIFKENLLLP